MTASRFRWLGACAALAGGELLPAAGLGCAESWPLAALLAVLALLFGYGLGLSGWRYVVLFLAGVALFQAASVPAERLYRESPWLRHAPRRVMRDRVGDSRPVFASVRRELSRRVGMGLEASPDAAALNRAILLGERARLPRVLKRAFVESGSIHIFAISGLHVMVVAEVLVVLLSCLFLPRRWVGLLAVPILWGYVLTIGSPPSAVRAVMMATFAHLGACFWRRSDLLQAWALTFLSVYAFSPRLIVDVGAALSFAVMLALALAVDWSRDFGWLRSRLFVTFVAWAAGAPLSACVFGRLTPGGLLANLVMLPAAEGTVSIGVLGVVASCVSETAAVYLNNLSAVFTSTMAGVSQVVSSLPGANFDIGCRSWQEAAGVYCCLVCIAGFWRWQRQRRLFG